MMKLNRVLVVRNAAAMMGVDGAMDKNPAWPEKLGANT
jgi:hypothetical protein